jgi:hypothetical protein
MTSKILLATTLLLTACGNYSNEDLEFMNAVPTRGDLSASMPRSALTANEAELSRLTHETVAAFNDALMFLEAADTVRTFPPTTRIPNGRIWGPVDARETGWQWRFVITRAPEMPDVFDYRFELRPVGDGDNWIPFIDGWFAASNGARKGVGHFRIQTDPLFAADFPLEVNAKGESLKELIVDYSTAGYPIMVTMNMSLYVNVRLEGRTNITTIRYHHELQESGAGLMEFLGTGSDGKSISVVSQWMPTGRGRATATWDDGMGVMLTRIECWNDSFVETYDYTPWAVPPDPIEEGDPASCPDFSTP